MRRPEIKAACSEHQVQIWRAYIRESFVDRVKYYIEFPHGGFLSQYIDTLLAIAEERGDKASYAKIVAQRAKDAMGI